MTPSISGTVAAMVTPYDEGGELDLARARHLAGWLCERGIDALFVGGTTGEGPLLSLGEREVLTEAVVSAVEGRAGVLIQAGCASSADTVRLARHAAGAGADGIAVMSPFFYRYHRDALIDHFVTAAASVPDCPVYLYNIPRNTGNPITPDVLEAASTRASNIVGVKDSSRDLALLREFVELRSGDMTVLVGSDSVMLPGLEAGASGVVSAAATAFPEAVVRVVDASGAGDVRSARAALEILNGCLKLLKSVPTPAGYKAALERRGIPVGGVRAPLCNLSPVERNAFDALFDEIWPRVQGLTSNG